jgi:hypothetical protein
MASRRLFLEVEMQERIVARAGQTLAIRVGLQNAVRLYRSPTVSGVEASKSPICLRPFCRRSSLMSQNVTIILKITDLRSKWWLQVIVCNECNRSLAKR